MTALNGGLPKKANESIEDFVAEFIDHISHEEWQVIALLPKIRHVFELVAVVVKIREQADYPLPYDHPLNPARRYEVVS